MFYRAVIQSLDYGLKLPGLNCFYWNNGVTIKIHLRNNQWMYAGIHQCLYRDCGSFSSVANHGKKKKNGKATLFLDIKILQ